MPESMLRRLPDDHRQLLKATEDDHTGGILFSLGRLLLQEATAESEKIGNIEIEIGIERCLVRLVPLTVGVIPVYIPVRAAGVE